MDICFSKSQNASSGNFDFPPGAESQGEARPHGQITGFVLHFNKGHLISSIYLKTVTKVFSRHNFNPAFPSCSIPKKRGIKDPVFETHPKTVHTLLVT